MTKVFAALAVSVDGYLSGRDARPGAGLGDAAVLFDWYGDGDTPSRFFDGYRLSAGSARVFDHTAARVGAVLAGRTTYDHSGGWGGGSPHPSAPLVVLTHRPISDASPTQTVVASGTEDGIEDAIAAARELAGTKDVALMGGELLTAALRAGLVDELVLHQVAVLLGGGRRLFGELPGHVRLEPIEITPADGVTHLRYRVERTRSAESG